MLKLSEKPYTRKISALLGLPLESNPFQKFPHSEGALYLLPNYEELAGNIMEHSFLANNLDKYMKQGKRGCYKLDLNRITVIIKPKKVLSGHPLMPLDPADEARRKCPLNEIVCALQVRYALANIDGAESEKPIGFFESSDGRCWTIFEMMEGDIIFGTSVISDELKDLMKQVVKALLDVGIDARETNQDQFLKGSDNRVVLTDFEAYHPA